jgi:hypothetical protein
VEEEERRRIRFVGPSLPVASATEKDAWRATDQDGGKRTIVRVL